MSPGDKKSTKSEALHLATYAEVNRYLVDLDSLVWQVWRSKFEADYE
jgi:hypothetical protein